MHATTTGGKYGNVGTVKVNKKNLSLKKGSKFKLIVTEIKKDKTFKRHRKMEFESTNPKVAVVTKKGIIKAKGKGNCTIYIYAQNGVYKTVKVKVK